MESRIPRVVAIPADDAVLVQQVRDGSREAFTELVRLYQDRVYNLCWRVCGHPEDALDLTQDAFLKALQSIGSFQSRSGFYTWVYRIATNLAISHRRKSRTRSAASLEGSPARRDGDESVSLGRTLPDGRAVEPGRAMAESEEHQAVSVALLELPPDQRAVLVLRDMEGLDYAQIAEVLELPVGTVKSRICRARLALRAALERSGAWRRNDAQ